MTESEKVIKTLLEKGADANMIDNVSVLQAIDATTVDADD
jgi:hypothetical protein